MFQSYAQMKEIANLRLQKNALRPIEFNKEKLQIKLPAVFFIAKDSINIDHISSFLRKY